VSAGAHFCQSAPLALCPKAVSISTYVASTPAFASLSITLGAIEGGKSESVRERT